MHFTEELAKTKHKLNKLHSTEAEIRFFENNFRIINPQTRCSEPVKLREYQKDFLWHINNLDEETFFCRKCRQCWVTTLYALHLAYILSSTRSYTKQYKFLYHLNLND